MPKLSPDAYQKWLNMRKQTMIIFVFQSLLLGMDASLTLLTLYMYLKEDIKSDMTLMYYSVISVLFYLPSLCFSAIIGYLVDRYRNVRLTFFTINVLMIVGNLLYALPYSPWFLMVGRLLAGVGGPLRSVMTGEIARSYSADTLRSKLSYMGLSYCSGYIAGPAFNVVFRNIEFTIMSWKVTYLNIPGLYMAVLFSILQVMSVIMLSNLSKVYDLKMETMKDMVKEDVTINNPIEEAKESTHLLNRTEGVSSSIHTLRKMLANFDIVLLLSLAFFQYYFANCFVMWRPLIVIEKMHWTIYSLGFVYIGQGVSCVLPCLFFIFGCTTSNKFIFYVAVLTQPALIFIHVIFIVLFDYNTNLYLNISLWIMYCVLYIPNIVVEEIFLVGALAQMVSSKYQVFADGIRLTAYRMGGITALSMSALIFDRMNIVATVHVGIILLCFVLLIIRRETLKNPTIVIS